MPGVEIGIWINWDAIIGAALWIGEKQSDEEISKEIRKLVEDIKANDRRKTTMKKIIIVSTVAILLFACASVGHKLDQTQVAKITKGETTREQILALVGSPEQITRLGNGDTVFTYLYSRATTKPATFIPFIGGFVGGMNVQNQSLVITFNEKGIVKDIISTYGATESSMGITTGSKPEIKDVEENKREN